jgi:hypothetical protein
MLRRLNRPQCFWMGGSIAAVLPHPTTELGERCVRMRDGGLKVYKNAEAWVRGGMRKKLIALIAFLGFSTFCPPEFIGRQPE